MSYCEKHRQDYDSLCWSCSDGLPACAIPTPMDEKAFEQAWIEIRDTMADSLLNMGQKKAFVISILKGHLANPPSLGGYNG